eukprot:IDg23021t1
MSLLLEQAEKAKERLSETIEQAVNWEPQIEEFDDCVVFVKVLSSE